MIVWGGILNVSIGALFLAGVVPGLLIGLAQMGTVHAYAGAAKKNGAEVIEHNRVLELHQMTDGWRVVTEKGTISCEHELSAASPHLQHEVTEGQKRRKVLLLKRNRRIASKIRGEPIGTNFTHVLTCVGTDCSAS